ncbi:hypothetical protein AAG906_012979 [Vitis piasezkii]
MERSKSVATPLVVNEKLSKNEVNIKVDASVYKSLIGSMLYLMFSRSLLSRFMHSPSKIHFGVAKRVLSQPLLLQKPMQHGSTKHINVKFHAIREAEKNGEVNLVHCCSENQIADILTKALSKAKFEELRSRLESLRKFSRRSVRI